MLEVGLGGRLDAVNVVDADCAVLTSVAIDHVDYLGATREAIGREKAGIFRAGRPAVVADPDPPRSVLDAPRREAAVHRAGFRLHRGGVAVDATGGPAASAAGSRIRRCAARSSCATPRRRCARSTRCASGCRSRCRTCAAAWRRSTLPARFEVLPGRPQVDPRRRAQRRGGEDARAAISPPRASRPRPSRSAACCATRTSPACCARSRRGSRAGTSASLPGPRAAAAGDLAAQLAALGVARASIHAHESPAQAFAAARESAGENDKIVVFGSFLTVGEVKAWLSDNKTSKR